MAEISYFENTVLQYTSIAENLQRTSYRFAIPGDTDRVFNADQSVMEQFESFDPDKLRAYYVMSGTVQRIETEPAPDALPDAKPRVAYVITPEKLKPIQSLSELQQYGVSIKKVNLQELPKNTRRGGRTSLGPTTWAEARLQFSNPVLFPDSKIAAFVQRNRAKYEQDTGKKLPPDPKLQEYLASVGSSNRPAQNTVTMEL